ncbi:hypothetical protein QSP13_09890 [Clostridioides difficile]|uniref:Uncharacterized protein n=1 Tax=Clostridioides difficile ATCC 9689 = DSM 1296 TaxID=1121308 RepID=A0AC59FV85_CLODI|nr:hypothetical protein [Clostridioides difficile]HDN2469749.1 hypothetical protein [Clostridioides difficile CD196]AKP41244.1 hypothetical protein CDIF1296T_00346 [Clostridioides difficile ATCC 9689 = DSM 1296]EIS9216739.1 hypothetical protein [Clostridioides difficile]EIS9330960.1 hypothetical protein [Clostridioides difficile]EIS9334524.1 hypothetical protein [Clostridioides difficile]
MTNFEMIKSLDEDGMANFFGSTDCICEYCIYEGEPCGYICYESPEGFKEWLYMEVEE